MIHLYCGDGKGKTTAAMGLCLRMAGRGKRAVVAQFLKGADSGERAALAALPGVVLLPVPEKVKFSFRLSQSERQAEQSRYLAMLEQAEAAQPFDLLVLDEACAAVNTGLLPLERLLSLLDGLPPHCEVVLTGRDPPPEFSVRADYITRFEKLRHPYERGVPAREGVEY